jgi:phage shock protein E
VSYSQLVKNGAPIVDLRSKEEFSGGYIKDPINISVDTLKNNLDKLNKDKVIITCCASGMRSASAKSMLKFSGFNEVYNGGGWSSLNVKVN